jgi:O-acetyl-ADP-ribose deacetylase (regulator of RNase III)
MIIVSAAVLLAVCLGILWWGARPAAAGQRHALLILAWLCAALCATLVVFSAFPASTADGSILGVTTSGAAMFVVLVWTVALRASRRAERRDKLEAQIQGRTREIKRLVREREDLRRQGRPPPLEITDTIVYQLAGRGRGHGRQLAIITGDLRRVRCAEVWVNSENTDMRMARVNEHSISALIRYEGAVRDGLGQVTDDVIAVELDRKVSPFRPVPAGTVVLTDPGQLSRSGVRKIAHVASVIGEPGAGFRQVREIGRCVYNVLAAVGGPMTETQARSVIFPLLGVGDGGGDLHHTIETMTSAILNYFHSEPATTITFVYLLAYTEAELDGCTAILGARTELSRVPAPQ